MKNKFWIIQMPTYGMIAFVCLNLMAMYFYPGGNMNNPNQIGYYFSYNFFSDLGATMSHSGENNLVSCFLFNSSLCIVGITFGMLFYTIKNFFSDFPIFSSIATILGIIGCISFIGVAFTPSNLFLDLNGDPWLHIIFAHWIFRSLSAVSIIYSILIIKTDYFENKYAYNFIICGLLVFIYVLYSELFLLNPREYPEYLIKHVLSQKMVVIWILLSMYIYSIGLGKYFLKISHE